ncbi:hypothetical protein FE257_010315 [Aspergillus nanangensis]|uniref:FAD-binding domain-containing protein n=1 Tax=Aspergillus nanangensis TaxID=2582783 RepID=A0AAD4GS84_ASPNN|nr:hypothetical protein FE257_010315 [Aspergillus nanangensis]
MSSPPPRIAIIGAGPAGLTLGLLLHKHTIPFTIFELRPKPTEADLAKPSGMLDLHEESGIAAIRACGLFDEFIQLTGECAESQVVADKDGNILYSDEGELSQRPEISRHALTKLLTSHLPEEAIRWGRKVLSATTSCPATGEIETEITFDDGGGGPEGKQSFDLVVGADGAWSRVRTLLTDVKPGYSGIQLLTATVRHVTAKYPHLAKLVGRGSFSALGRGHAVMSHRGPQDSARIYVCLSIADEEFATSNFGNMSATEVKSWLLTNDALLGLWGPVMKELVTVVCDEESADNPHAVADIRPLYTLPIGADWAHHASATLVGDAAHLMSPWAGEGVNLAMWDSLLLAGVIVQACRGVSFQETLGPLMQAFEVEMAARAKEKAEETHSNGQMLFGENAAQDFVDFFCQVYPEGQSGRGIQPVME